MSAMTPKKSVDLPKLLTVRLDDEIRGRLEEMAMDEERNLGQMARILLREAIRARDAARVKGKRRF